MAFAAELAAREFEVSRAGGGELHPLDCASRNGVLVEAEGWDVERVDHIARAKEDMDGLSDGDDELSGSKVVFASGVGWIDAELIFHAETLHIACAELSIGPGIAQIPAELVANNIYGNGIRRDRRRSEFEPDTVRPDCQEKEDGCGNDGPPEFKGVIAVAIVGLVSRTATVADQVNNVNALSQDKYHQRENEDEIEQGIDFFSTDRDIWRGPEKIGSALLGLGGKTAPYEKKCGDGKDSQQEVHSRVKSGGGRCGGRCGGGRGCRSGASCRNGLCGNSFKFFLCPRIFAVRSGGADGFHIIHCDGRGGIAPLGANVSKDGCNLFVFELSPCWHGVVVCVSFDLHRPLHASEKNFDKVVVAHPSSADDPFAAYKWRKLSSDAHARALVANGAILAEKTFTDNFGIGCNSWTSTSTTAP